MTRYCLSCGLWYPFMDPGKYLFKEFTCKCDSVQLTLEAF